jgi:hypothetical protein
VGDDGVVLSDRERAALAGLAEQIGDPWLARQLTGQDGQAPRPKQRLSGSIRPRLSSAAGSVWFTGLLLLAGAVLAVMTFAHSTVLASLGLLLMAVGLWRLAVGHGDAIIRHVTERLTERRAPAPVPSSPPRTPPAAT